MYMLFITVSEIFPDSISFAVEKCTGIKISSVSEKNKVCLGFPWQELVSKWLKFEVENKLMTF